MQIEIMPAAPTDAGELMTLQRAAYLSEARLHADFDLPPLVETLAEVRAAIERERALKAVLGARIVGQVRGRLAGRTGHIGRLSVVPDMQGVGIGTRLLAAIEADLAGAERFELFTGERSLHNIRLYERLGYTQIPAPGGAPEMVIFLEKIPGARRSDAGGLAEPRSAQLC